MPVELGGRATEEDGGHLRIHASAKALTFDGVVDGSMLQGKLRATTTELVHAKRGVAEMASGPTKLGAEIGGRRFVVDWDQHGERVKSTFRDASVARALEGTSRDERFELMGDGVTLRGVMSGIMIGIGEWSDRGKTQPVALDWVHTEIPAPYSLPNGGRIVPLERWSRGVAGCPSSLDVVPQIEGLATPFTWPTPSTQCHDTGEVSMIGMIWNTSTFTILAAGSDWFSLHRDVYSYIGGAHGMSGESCQIVSLSTGKATSLQIELPDASLAKLGAMVRSAILASAPGKSLVDLGFFKDDPKVTQDRVMCAVTDHGGLALEVVYQHDMDEAGNFRFTDVRPRIPAAKVRALFPAGSTGALVFR